jgi:predicted dehydrogenase
MVIFRHGSLHAQYAMPFIEAGMPVWIDKPFTCDVKEAESLVEAAKRKGTILTGGSTTKFSKDCATLKYAVGNDLSLGAVKSGYLNFPGDISSEYSGIFFYGPHLVEIMLHVFGRGVKSVISNVHKGELVATVRYDDFQVILNFAKQASKHMVIVYGEKKTMHRELDTSACYRLGFDKWYKALMTKQNPEPLENLVMPVKVLCAIQESIDTGKEAFV